MPGDYSKEVPPVPIPNTEVKLFSADGTATRGRVGHRQAFFYLFSFIPGLKQKKKKKAQKK